MSRAKILVADDSATIQKVFELAFESEDIDVELSGDGDDALVRIKKSRPSMVIADVNMPGLDGFELCETLKGDPATASIPVYLMGSALDDFDEERAASVGAAGRFEKPFRSEDMVSRVRQVIASAPPPLLEPEEDEIIVIDEPEQAASGEEDTFEDIDVPLDSLLDTVASEPLMEDESLLDETPEGDLLASSEPALPMGAAPAILELGEEALQTGEMDEEEEDEVEIVSGQDEMIVEGSLESGEIIFAEDHDALELAAPREVDFEEPADLAETQPYAVEPSAAGLSDEGLKLLREIDAEVEEGISKTGEELEEFAQAAPPESPAAEWDGPTRATLERLLAEGALTPIVEKAVERAVGERLGREDLENAITAGVRQAIEEMKPRLMEDFARIAREITLNMAEGLIRKTIDQIRASQD